MTKKAVRLCIETLGDDYLPAVQQNRDVEHQGTREQKCQPENPSRS